MAVVTYCLLQTSTGLCVDKFEWDDTYTYTPATGFSLAPNASGEIGWTWNGSAWVPNTGTPQSTPSAPANNVLRSIDALQGSVVAGDTLYADDTNNFNRLPIGSAGEVLTVVSGIPDWTPQTASITFIIDGGGSAITTGEKGDITIPFACTINEWTLLADQSGSIVVDIWKDTYANYPPVVGDSITASAKPTISSATKGQSSTLTGWTTTINAGDVLAFNVDSASTVQRVTLSLKVTKV